MDLLEISKDVSMVQMAVKPAWIGKNLLQLNLRKKYSINVVAIIQNDRVSINIDPELPLEESMRLIVIANPVQLNLLDE